MIHQNYLLQKTEFQINSFWYLYKQLSYNQESHCFFLDTHVLRCVAKGYYISLFELSYLLRSLQNIVKRLSRSPNHRQLTITNDLVKVFETWLWYKLKFFLLKSSQKYLVFFRKFLLKTQGGNYIRPYHHDWYNHRHSSIEVQKFCTLDKIEIYHVFHKILNSVA